MSGRWGNKNKKRDDSPPNPPQPFSYRAARPDDLPVIEEFSHVPKEELEAYRVLKSGGLRVVINNDTKKIVGCLGYKLTNTSSEVKFAGARTLDIEKFLTIDSQNKAVFDAMLIGIDNIAHSRKKVDWVNVGINQDDNQRIKQFNEQYWGCEENGDQYTFFKQITPHERVESNIPPLE